MHMALYVTLWELEAPKSSVYTYADTLAITIAVSNKVVYL